VSGAGSQQASGGPNGNYLFELEAQPGGPVGWPIKKTGSKPIAISGRPRDDRPAHNICGFWAQCVSSRPLPGPFSRTALDEEYNAPAETVRLTPFIPVKKSVGCRSTRRGQPTGN